MQGIYTCIPETNYVPREYSVAAILLLLLVVLISLVSVFNLLYLLLLLLLVVSLMQSVYNCIPQRNHISRVTFSFAGILCLQIYATCMK
jgi:hypothetical protein